jgi:hypothetical protein
MSNAKAPLLDAIIDILREQRERMAAGAEQVSAYPLGRIGIAVELLWNGSYPNTMWSSKARLRRRGARDPATNPRRREPGCCSDTFWRSKGFAARGGSALWRLGGRGLSLSRLPLFPFGGFTSPLELNEPGTGVSAFRELKDTVYRDPEVGRGERGDR